MRRKDREVTDFDAIASIIDRCDVLRLGLSDGDFPYVVPVNFAYEARDGRFVFYIHGAMGGRKYELLSSNPLCSFEMDVPLEIECLSDRRAVTMRYQSVMGKARTEFLTGAEKQWAMDRALLARYEKTRRFDYDRATLERTAVVKLTVLEITAKQNLPRAADGPNRSGKDGGDGWSESNT